MRVRDIDPSLPARPKLKSGVSIRAHALADRRLDELTLGDVAFCLRQGIAVQAVVDRAMRALATRPLREVEGYQGDLLRSMLHAETKGWLVESQRDALRMICSAAITACSFDNDELRSLATSLVHRTEPR